VKDTKNISKVMILINELKNPLGKRLVRYAKNTRITKFKNIKSPKDGTNFIDFFKIFQNKIQVPLNFFERIEQDIKIGKTNQYTNSSIKIIMISI